MEFHGQAKFLSGARQLIGKGGWEVESEEVIKNSAKTWQFIPAPKNKIEWRQRHAAMLPCNWRSVWT